MFERSIRRHHKDRMKNKAKKFFPNWSGAIKIADHLKNCSCSICCNPRRSELNKKHNKLTMQEKRKLADALSQIKEI